MKKIIIILLGFLIGFPILAQAKEAVLNDEYLKNIYSIHTLEDGSVEVYQEAMFRLDGKLAYCLNPSLLAQPGSYTVTEGLSGSYLSDSQKAQVEAYGYFGYEYPGHGTISYYLAAQELIWEYIYNSSIEWSTKGNGTGEVIDVEKEKNEILSLIEATKILPSFASEKISLYEGESLELQDTNHVLHNFKMNQESLFIEKDVLKSNALWKDIKGKGTYQKYDNEVTLLYRQEGSQKLATLRLSDLPKFEISIQIEGVSMTIHKIGEVFKGIYSTGEWKGQNGVEFELYAEEDIYGHFGNIIYQKGDYIETLTTKKGIAKTRKLPDGKYQLVETKGKDNYLKSEPVVFEINNSVEKNPELEVKNYFSTGNIEIVKKSETGEFLTGVVFGLYSKGGKKIEERITDEQGKIRFERLPIGEYRIKEIKTIDGFILDTAFKNIIVAENETIYVEQINRPLLPNTSGKTKWNGQVFIGLFGILLSRKLWVS